MQSYPELLYLFYLDPFWSLLERKPQRVVREFTINVLAGREPVLLNPIHHYMPSFVWAALYSGGFR
jgi:hypothetical protein